MEPLLGSPRILSTATAVPPHRVEQWEIKEVARGLFAEKFRDLERLLPIFDNGLIEARYFCQPLEWFEWEWSFPERNALYVEHAFERLGSGRGKVIRVLHVPLIAMRLYGRTSPYARELANMMAFFDAVSFAADPSILRDTFGIPALSIVQWASNGRQPRNDREEPNNGNRQGS
jgi:hypothetical protein